MFKVIELLIDDIISGETGVFEVAWVENPAIEQDFMYFSAQKFFKAPDDVSNTACRAIKENEKRGNPAATQVGKIRGQSLCNKSEISLETIKRMKSFLERAATYYTGDYDDNGTIAYDLWGGKNGLEWVNGILRDEDKEELGIQDFAEVGPRGGIRESKKAPKSDTPNKNPKGVGSAKGDASKRGATVSAEVEKTLQKKVDDFNEKDSNTKNGRATLGQLKTVYARGLAAYNTSHSPNVSSPQQWSYARTNAYLYLLKNGRPQNPKYKQDNDLLPSAHPKKDKMSSEFALGDKVSFDWDDTLNTKNGVKLLEQEMSRGSLIYIISSRNITTKEMIDLATEYGFPARNIYTVGSNQRKIETIEKLGIKRHYDNNLNVVQEIPSVGIKFDYDVSQLPDFDNYPSSGDTDAMLVKPFLGNEGCGCNDPYEFEVLGYIDGHPTFATKEEAEKHGSEVMNCTGTHEHTDEQGNVVYMSCETHPEKLTFSMEDYSEEEVEVANLLLHLKETDILKFEAVVGALRGATAQEVKDRKHKTPTTYFRYDRILSGSPDRDFCTSIENRYFRRLEIDLLRPLNTEFGHNRQPYSKWLYLGGPNCIHAWSKVLVQDNVISEQGLAPGLSGTPMKSRPLQGYYSEETKRKSEVAYIISQEKMGSVSLMDEKQFDCAFGDACYLGTTEKQVFSVLAEKRMIYTPLMIPDILIPRIDESSQEKYWVKFSPETIEKIQQKFMIEQRLRDTNYEHTDKKFKDIVMVESWIIQGEKDKAYELGFSPSDLPVGTWMGGYKILESPEGQYVYDNYIKNGKVKGASVEGNFILNFSVQDNDDYLLSQIINILQQIN